MALKEYDVEINGRLTTLQLSDEDAKAMGLKASDAAKEKPAPANKEAKAPANKSSGAKAPSARQAAAAGEAFGAEKSQD